jgi:hypothetical protein
MKVGIYNRTFVKNVVAIGLSAGFIEPLESNGLFSVHEFLFKLVDILERNDISQFDRDMYNTSVRDLFNGFSKFVALHYALSHRDDSKYWREIRDKRFVSADGDPDLPYLNRTNSFYNLINLYMDHWEWQGQFSSGGIPYIATGMNLNMMNRSRIEDVQFRFNVNLKEEAEKFYRDSEKRKLDWANHAKSCESLKDFLGRRFYDDGFTRIVVNR